MALVIPIPYETNHGRVEAGDPVVFLSTHAGSPTFGRGTYLGVSAQNTQKVVIEYQSTQRGWKHVDADEPMSYGWLQKWMRAQGKTWISGSPDISYVPYTAKKRKTLQLNRIIPARN